MTGMRVGQSARRRLLVRVTHVSTIGESKAVDPVGPMHQDDVRPGFYRSMVRATHKTADLWGLGVRNGRHAHRRSGWTGHD